MNLNENNYNENNTNEYTYGEGYSANEEPAAGPDTYSYEEFPPTGNDVPPTDQEPQQTSYYQPEPAPKTGFAVASLVLGIISLPQMKHANLSLDCNDNEIIFE